jgi:hypothetical protein
MLARNEMKKIKNVNKHIAALKKKCLFVRRRNIIETLYIIDDMCDWCSSNVGERRRSHPLDEANTGWISRNNLGNWALTFDTNNNLYIFWFERYEDKIMFNLVWNFG